MASMLYQSSVRRAKADFIDSAVSWTPTPRRLIFVVSENVLFQIQVKIPDAVGDQPRIIGIISSERQLHRYQ